MRTLPTPPTIVSQEWATQNNRLLQLELGRMDGIERRLATLETNVSGQSVAIQYDLSGDESTTVTTGTAKRTWRMPVPFYLQRAYASLTTASSSGVVTVDINGNGSSLFGTDKLTIDESEETSVTAATPVALDAQTIEFNTELTFDVDTAGTGAVGLKAYLVGYYLVDSTLTLSGALDAMTVAVAYSDTITVTGGVPPYEFVPIESLPAGITKTLAGGNASPVTISGTPTGVGLGPGTAIPFVVTFIVQDSIGSQAIFSQSVTVNVPAVTVTIDGGSLPDATVGAAYSHDVDATGGIGSPYTFTKIAGPSWLTVDSSTGAITGTPGSGDVGTGITVTVRARDSEGNFGDVSDTMDVFVGYNEDTFSTDSAAQYTLTKNTASTNNIVVESGYLTVDHVTHTGGGSESSVTRNGTSITDGYVEAVIGTMEDGGLIMRFVDQENFYMAALSDDSGGNPFANVRLFKQVSGTYTQLGSNTNISWTRGTSKTIRLTCTGTSIDVSVDGSSVLAVTDSSLSSAGKIGVRSNSPTIGKFNFYETLRWA